MVTKRIQKKLILAIRDYISHLTKEGLSVHKVYLYGSQARGHAKKSSDVDIAIISPDFKNDFDALQYLWVQLRNRDIKNRLEPVGFTPKSFNPKTNPLALIIVNEGLEIH